MSRYSSTDAIRQFRMYRSCKVSALEKLCKQATDSSWHQWPAGFSESSIIRKYVTHLLVINATSQRCPSLSPHQYAVWVLRPYQDVSCTAAGLCCVVGYRVSSAAQDMQTLQHLVITNHNNSRKRYRLIYFTVQIHREHNLSALNCRLTAYCSYFQGPKNQSFRHKSAKPQPIRGKFGIRGQIEG